MELTIATYADCVKASKTIQEWWELKKNIEVEIRNPTKDRSKQQNKLYWKWMGVIGGETGDGKDGMADIYKGLFLIKIYVDAEEAKGKPGKYTKLAEAMEQIKKSVPEKEYLFLRAQVIAQVSTTDASVKQMTEYLNKIKAHAQSMLQIALPLPEHEGLL